MRLTTYLYLVHWLRMSGVLPSFFMYAFMSFIGTTLFFVEVVFFRLCLAAVDLCYLLLAPEQVKVKVKAMFKLSLCTL